MYYWNNMVYIVFAHLINAGTCLLNVNVAGSLVTTPPAIDGVLTSCGETRLTCSHENIAGASTGWTITRVDSSPLCAVVIPHSIPSPATPYRCGEFTFEDITAQGAAVEYLNSTGMVNPLPLNISGSRMGCFAGSDVSIPPVGSVVLCVICKFMW